MEKNESIGVVSGAYSVGRNEILQWINDLTQLNYAKIEQTASGVFVCHVFDALYPGQLRLGKVKFDARHSYDYIHNYKVLQACFDRVGMKRQIDVEKLIKGKYQDNFEFMQWVKAYFDAHASEEAHAYNGAERRKEVSGGRVTTPTISATTRPPRVSNGSAPGARTAKPRSTTTAAGRTTDRPHLYGSGPGPKGIGSRVGGNGGAKSMMNSNTQLIKLKQELEQLKKDKEELQTTVEDAVTEREFYFNKLRKVELICQSVNEHQNDPDAELFDVLRNALEDIKSALYAEEDEPVDEEVVPEGEDDGQFQDADDGFAEAELQEDPQYEEEAPIVEQDGRQH